MPAVLRRYSAKIGSFAAASSADSLEGCFGSGFCGEGGHPGVCGARFASRWTSAALYVPLGSLLPPLQPTSVTATRDAAIPLHLEFVTRRHSHGGVCRTTRMMLRQDRGARARDGRTELGALGRERPGITRPLTDPQLRGSSAPVDLDVASPQDLVAGVVGVDPHPVVIDALAGLAEILDVDPVAVRA